MGLVTVPVAIPAMRRYDVAIEKRERRSAKRKQLDEEEEEETRRKS